MHFADARSGRRAGDRESGFTILEVSVALTIFAIVIVGLTSSLGSGLRLTRSSNARQSAVQVAHRDMELLRAYAYPALGLAEPVGTWGPGVTGTPPSYTPPLPRGPVSPEPVVLGGSVAHTAQETLGVRSFRLWRFITWADSPTNTQKRITIVVEYAGTDASGPDQIVISSLFAEKDIEFRASVLATTTLTAAIPPHAVGQAVTLAVDSASGFPPSPSFQVTVDGESFTVTDLGPTGTEWTAFAGGTDGHTNGAPVTYVDSSFGAPGGGGGSPTTTTSTTAPPPDCGSDRRGPSVRAFSVVGGTGPSGQKYVNTASVDLVAASTDSCLPQSVSFSNDGTSFGPARVVSSAAAQYPWTVTAGDGLKTVWARFADGVGNATVETVEFLLDSLAPAPAPSGLTVTTVRAGGKDAYRLDWSNVTRDANFRGYLVFREAGAAGGAVQVGVVQVGTGSAPCRPTAATCSFTDTDVTAGTSYTYFVVGADWAGNQSGSSNVVTR